MCVRSAAAAVVVIVVVVTVHWMDELKKNERRQRTLCQLCNVSKRQWAKAKPESEPAHTHTQHGTCVCEGEGSLRGIHDIYGKKAKQ